MISTALVLAAALGVGVNSGQAPAPAATDVAKFTISAPATIRDIDIKGVRGAPTRMAWSPDGQWLYVRLSTFDRWDNETVRHLLVETAGKRVETLSEEPGWLPRYWNLKSAATSPALPSWRIRVDTRQELLRTTNVPREGNISQSGGDPNAGLDEVIGNAVMSSQKTTNEQYLLNGHVIAAATNGRVVPGRSFAWAPAPLALIAYVSDKGRLVVMNHAGHTREVKGPKKPLIPAWSDDGHRLAYAQASGGGYSIRVVDIR